MMKNLRPPQRTCCPLSPPPKRLMKRAEQQIHLPQTSLGERGRLAAPDTHRDGRRLPHTRHKETRIIPVAMVTVRNIQELHTREFDSFGI